MENLSVDILNELSIHQLRGYARNCGVKSPTTLKKEQLIDEILQIQTGKKQPTNSNMGRKPKVNYQDLFQDQNRYSLHSPTSGYSDNIFITDGQVKISNNTSPVIRIENELNQIVDIPLKKSLLQEYGLHIDDVVTCELKSVDDSFSYEVENIVKVNGYSFDEYNNQSFDYLTASYNNSDYLVLNDLQILKGTSSYFLAKNKEQLIKCEDYIKQLVNADYKVILLDATNSPSPLTNNISIQLHNLKFDKSFFNLHKTIILTQEQVKKHLVDKTQVVFVICGLDEIVKIIKYAQTNEISDSITPEIITNIRKLTHLSRYISPNSNITTLIFDTTSDNDNIREFVQKDIISSVNYYFELN